MKVLIKFYRFPNTYNLKFRNNDPLNLFWNLHGRAICFLNFIKWGKASILLILLKCIVFGYSNGNESFTGRLLSNYSRWICYSIFFDISFIVFSRGFWQKVYEENIPFQLNFQKSISRCSILLKIRMSNFVTLKWWPFEYRVVFSEIKNADILNLSWIKYVDNDFSFLKKWHTWV